MTGWMLETIACLKTLTTDSSKNEGTSPAQGWALRSRHQNVIGFIYIYIYALLNWHSAVALLIVMVFYGVVGQLAHSNISNISKNNIVDKAKNWMSFYLRVSFANLIASSAKHVKQQSFSNKCCWSPTLVNSATAIPPQDMTIGKICLDKPPKMLLVIKLR